MPQDVASVELSEDGILLDYQKVQNAYPAKYLVRLYRKIGIQDNRHRSCSAYK